MPKKFERLGVSFQYPDNWTLDDGDAVAGRDSITVYCPTGPFWTLAVHEGNASLEDLAQEVVAAIQKEYTEIEVEPLTEEVLGESLSGYEMHFFYLDLITTAEVRCVRIGDKAYSFFCQGEDKAFDKVAKVFQAMMVSLIAGLKNIPPGVE